MNILDISRYNQIKEVNKMRCLDNEFMVALKTGSLNPVLKLVHKDQTLCLEIRENYVNIYYRGGNILRIDKNGSNYNYVFNSDYFVHDRFLMPPQPVLPTSGPITAYLELIPILKQEMDRWFVENPKLEREVQQMILRDNNIDRLANDTDYYISDIEYANTENGSRFDIVGLKWISDRVKRRDRKQLSLSLMELKYGDDSLTKESGIVKHFEDIGNFVKSNGFNDFVDEVEKQFNQKIELGLIYNQNRPILINKEARKEFILIFTNHKAASSILNRELMIAMDMFPTIETDIDVLIAQSSFMGYGLYAEKMKKVGTYISEVKASMGL